MFDTVLVVLSIASSFVAVYLISQDPEFLNLSSRSSSSSSSSCGHHHYHLDLLFHHHDQKDVEEDLDKVVAPTCPSNSSQTVCSGRGSCQAEVCTCDEGWVGEDCSQPWCPLECNGRGKCYEGFCVCDNGWAGASCDIDRLQVTAGAMLDGVDFEAFSNSSECHFLARDLFVDNTTDGKFGKFEYFSVGSKRTEAYRFPLDKFGSMPKTCPDYKYRTCAFVGNSGTMKLSTHGSEIDGHDMVYRFNQAPTEGYEDHVGTRTTFESLNAKHAHNLLRLDTEWNWRDPVPIYLLFEPLKLKETLVDIHHKYPEVKMLVLSPAFFRKAHEIYDKLQSELERHEFGCFSGEKPMSGFYSLLISLTMCDKIDMYGFQPWEDWMAQGEQRLHYHYFDSEEPRPGAHSFDAAYFIYRVFEMSTELGLTIKRAGEPEEEQKGENAR
ncbi:sialyltransferase [Chloropicon primus]|uniref:Sialyltransferase n=1 Tax=Chloropicon primus TaxID=1764295 RepID=A0A5B8MI85_9CHLO|nr:sialyltransferase [Chloropicon primus]UPQ98299.1 sialyltransferase [Chloropicon primus]|eukprot:QDZ19090.1 sialyltransferase [Chloropicon primus]